MPADLTVAGIDLRVLEGSWTERESLYQGGKQRMRAGTLISTEMDSTRKRIIDCLVDLYDDAEEAAFRAACPRGESVTVEGGLPFTSITAVVDIGAVQAIADGAEVIRAVQVHIEEV